MHHAQRLLDKIYPLKSGHPPLTGSQAQQLSVCLKEDRKNYVYSGLVSYGGAIQALLKSSQSWPLVQCYYSVFYSLRALLASSGIAVFYIGKSPFWIRATSGCSPKKSSGTTHSMVITLFGQQVANSVLLSQQIAYQNASDWLMGLRESANYRNGRFPDPNWSTPFPYVARIGVRRLLSTYINDSLIQYPFDEDHAALAFPLLAIREALKGCPDAIQADEEREFLKSLFADKHGSIAEMLQACAI